MIHVTTATFENGVFKPDERPALRESARVRLMVEPLTEIADEASQQQAWATLEQLWKDSTFNSQGERLSRDQLHERH